MNIYIHQNNETAGPYDESAVREMLDSGEILLLTFARLEGEAAWRPLSEIITMREKPAAPPAPAPELMRPPPPLAGRETPNGSSQAAARSSAAPSVPADIQAAPSNMLKIECSQCGQHILVDRSHAGMTGACPTCGGAVTVPAAPPPAAALMAENESINESIVGRARGFAYRLTGLRPLEDFKISLLFGDVFKNRSRSDFDSYFTCGSPSTTPDPERLASNPPRPWFYLRMLVFGCLILFALCFGYEKFPDPKLLSALMMLGAFLVPLCCVALFFELNTPRNISVYQVVKLIIGGAILSLPVVLFLSRHANGSFWGTMTMSLATEIAQALIAAALLRGTIHYNWILNGLLVGAAVAAGFAGIECASYMLYAFIDDLQRGDGKLTTYYAALRNYAGLVPLCQIVWMAILTGALWRVKEDAPFGIGLFFRRRFLRIFLLLAALQALWNSALLLAPLEKFSLFSTERAHWVIAKIEQGLWIVSIIGTCWLALLLVQEGLRQVREYGASGTETGKLQTGAETFE